VVPWSCVARAGIGKTTFLNAVVESAGDLLTVRLEGIESEMQLR
jgi:hypothetical protein